MFNLKKTISFIAIISGLLIIFSTPQKASAQSVQTIPMYRLMYSHYETGDVFGSKTDEILHFYTANKAERDSAIKNLGKDIESGFTNYGHVRFFDEGIEGYVLPSQLPGTVPLYRLYRNGAKHFYTANENEKNQATKSGYKFENIVGYISSTQTPGTTPLYRLYRAKKGNTTDDHFYTIKENEKLAAVQKHAYADEGITGYVWTSAVNIGPDGKVVKPIVIKRGDSNQQSNGNNGRPAAVITKDNVGMAFNDVYGYPPDAERTAYWSARNAGYDIIVTEESKRQNAEPIARKLMIARAYKVTMGRAATKAEIDYWLPKTEYFKQIVEASRSYLYAPNGAKDLVETIKRFLTEKSGKTPSDDEVTAVIKNYRKLKPMPVFDEMK